jgi:universal stress protein E
MQSFKSILVDIDASVAAHPALERAARLARSCGARLRIVDVLSIPSEARQYLRQEIERGLVDRRREQLDNLAASVTGVAADAALLEGRPAVALIREVLRSGHDLLMRSHARDIAGDSSSRKPFGAIDMQLFRQCPCPVWIVGPGALPSRPLIVGAVHASPDEAVEQALNTRIIDLTLLIARLEQGSAALLQAWTPFAEPVVRSHSDETDFSAYVESARRQANSDFEGLTRPFGDRLAGVRLELRRGDAEDVIPEFVVSESTDLVVMGTVARTGIAGFVIGNIAERLLQRLPCSVLAVKPEGFVSPVTLDETA